MRFLGGVESIVGAAGDEFGTGEGRGAAFDASDPEGGGNWEAAASFFFLVRILGGGGSIRVAAAATSNPGGGREVGRAAPFFFRSAYWWGGKGQGGARVSLGHRASLCHLGGGGTMRK